MNEKKNEPGIVRLTVTLLGICAACALILGLTNMVTKPVIEENLAKKEAAAIAAEVMPGFAGTLTQVNYTGTDSTINAILKTSDGGFVVTVSPKGSFSGVLTIMVGIDANKAVTGVSVTNSQETSGYGLRASEPEFRNQFVGKTGEIKLTKDGGEIESITGASTTSGAVCSGVTSAIAATDFVSDGPYVAPQPGDEQGVGDDLVELGGVIPGFDGETTPVDYTGGDDTILSIGKAGDMGYIVEVAPSGSFSGTLTMQVGVGPDGKVTGIGIMESGETSNYGARASEPEWQSQFVGLSGEVALTTDGGSIDSIAGASTTSRAVCAGVTSALAAVASLG